jgi:hypothetical protein
MRTTLALCLSFACACSVELEQVITPAELDTSERGAFTDDGRFFVIGTHPEGRSDTGSWIVEITRGSDGKYLSTNVLAGAIEGTSDSTLAGTPLGAACVFTGMTVRGKRLYAGCVLPDFSRTALIEVDTAARSVRAGYFTSCNAEPSSAPCQYSVLFPNGMAADAAGRIYFSNIISHLSITSDVPEITVEGSHSVGQVTLDANNDQPGKLSFTYRDWFSTDIFSDGLAPNGIQIEGQTLYYAAGANINRVQIQSDGKAGASGVHYTGPALTYIDDFAVRDQQMVLARTLPPALVALDRPDALGVVPELGTYPMDLDRIPSSVTHQAAGPNPVFPVDSLVVTAFVGGGVYVVTKN